MIPLSPDKGVPTSLMAIRQRTDTGASWALRRVPSAKESDYRKVWLDTHDVVTVIRADSERCETIFQAEALHMKFNYLDPRDSRRFGALTWADVGQRPCQVFRDFTDLYDASKITPSLRQATDMLTRGCNFLYGTIGPQVRRRISIDVRDDVRRTVSAINGIRVAKVPFHSSLKELVGLFEGWEIPHDESWGIETIVKCHFNRETNDPDEALMYFIEMKKLSDRYGVPLAARSMMVNHTPPETFHEYLEEVDDVLRTFGFYDGTLALELVESLLSETSMYCAREMIARKYKPTSCVGQ